MLLYTARVKDLELRKLSRPVCANPIQSQGPCSSPENSEECAFFGSWKFTLSGESFLLFFPGQRPEMLESVCIFPIPTVRLSFCTCSLAICKGSHSPSAGGHWGSWQWKGYRGREGREVWYRAWGALFWPVERSTRKTSWWLTGQAFWWSLQSSRIHGPLLTFKLWLLQVFAAPPRYQCLQTSSHADPLRIMGGLMKK